MNRKAFSLIELLVVVAIIGILSVILVPNVRVQLEKAKIAKTKALISNLEVQIEIFKNDFGKYPPSFDPQELYFSLVEESKSPFEPDSDDTAFFENGDRFWIREDNQQDDRRQAALQVAGVPSRTLTAQQEGFVFIDAWGNPIYYINSDDYNPGGRSDFRRANANRPISNAPAAYEIRDGKRYKPYNPTTFQLISFGPDQRTISPSTNNGGIGSMLSGDKRDNDDDDYIDLEDQVRGDPSADSPDAWAEDDITNF